MKDKSLLCKITFSLCLLGLLSALASNFLSEAMKGIFAWGYFVAPVLWFLWICCAFQTRQKKCGIFLLSLWVLIDLSILFLLLTFSSDTSFNQSIGVDITMLIAYFPVIVPIVFIHRIIENILPITAIYSPSSAASSAIIIWVEVSVLASIQSLIVYISFRFKAFSLEKNSNSLH